MHVDGRTSDPRHRPSGELKKRKEKTAGKRRKEKGNIQIESIAFAWSEATLARREIESRVSNCITDHIYTALRVPFGLRGAAGMDKGSPVNDITAPESQSQRKI